MRREPSFLNVTKMQHQATGVVRGRNVKQESGARSKEQRKKQDVL